jgi:hypothetical protein
MHWHEQKAQAEREEMFRRVLRAETECSRLPKVLISERLITPPNVGSGGGSCLPSMVVVAPGASMLAIMIAVQIISHSAQRERDYCKD